MTKIVIRAINKGHLMAMDPTLVGEVGPYKFYEHPIWGDEAPLIAVGNNECGLTDYFDLPTLEELQ